MIKNVLVLLTTWIFKIYLRQLNTTRLDQRKKVNSDTVSLVSSTSNTWWFYRLQIICDLSNVWTKQIQLILYMKPYHEMFLKLYQLFSRNIKTLNSMNIEIYIKWHIVWHTETARIRQWFWFFHRSHNNEMWKIFE